METTGSGTERPMPISLDPLTLVEKSETSVYDDFMTKNGTFSNGKRGYQAIELGEDILRASIKKRERKYKRESNENLLLMTYTHSLLTFTFINSFFTTLLGLLWRKMLLGLVYLTVVLF